MGRYLARGSHPVARHQFKERTGNHTQTLHTADFTEYHIIYNYSMFFSYTKTDTNKALEAMLRPVTQKDDGPFVPPQKRMRYPHSTYESNRLRTEKARVQRRLNQQKSKLDKQDRDLEFGEESVLSPGPGIPIFQTRAGHLQHYFCTKLLFTASKQDILYQAGDYKTFARDRARTVFSLIKALASLLHTVFEAKPVHHIVNTHIIDDTSTRMRGPLYSDPTTMYTIMNSIQSIHVVYASSDACTQDCEQTTRFRVPTPLICLEDATSKGIFEAFVASAVVTSKGVGSMLQKYGICKDVVQSTWRSFVFVGDSLKANQAAFRKECLEVLKKDDPKHLCLNFRCLIHQIALVRKPAVLMVPRLWSTIVRLAHLFETLSFRRAFATNLASVISNSFVYIPVAQQLPEEASWKSVRERLQANFRCKSSLKKRNLKAMLEFVNGDLESECVYHYCHEAAPGQSPCCTGSDDALGKCLRLIVPFFSRGFPVPLLYRFKHYDEAISFITLGLCTHGLLTRTLSSMDLAKQAGQKQQELIDCLLGDLDLSVGGQDGTDPAAFKDDEFEDFHAQTSKRKQLVYEEITKPAFHQSTLYLDFMIRPMDSLMNQLFHRSQLLTKLTLLGPCLDNWKEVAHKSRELFLSVASGSFGQTVVKEYCTIMFGGDDSLQTLADLGFDVSSQSHLHSMFVLGVHLVTDLWRRLVHEHNVPQYKLFSTLLRTTTLDGFVAAWDRFQGAKASCPYCFDRTFSQKVLNIYPGPLGLLDRSVQESVHMEVTQLLSDLATASPLSSDPVEVKNGQVQNITSRRGNQVSRARQPLGSPHS